jgi:hypothetical protein
MCAARIGYGVLPRSHREIGNARNYALRPLAAPAEESPICKVEYSSSGRQRAGKKQRCACSPTSTRIHRCVQGMSCTMVYIQYASMEQYRARLAGMWPRVMPTCKKVLHRVIRVVYTHRRSEVASSGLTGLVRETCQGYLHQPCVCAGSSPHGLSIRLTGNTGATIGYPPVPSQGENSRFHRI